MSSWLSRHARVLLALALLVTGAALILMGAVILVRDSGQSLFSSSAVGTTPGNLRQPTATEPILPPPPTASAGVLGIAPSTTETSLTPARTTVQTTLPPTPQRASATGPSGTDVPVTALAIPGTGTPAQARPTEPATGAPGITTAVVPGGLLSLRQRLGAGASAVRVTGGLASKLGFGWYLDWGAHPDSFRSDTVEYMPMIRLKSGAAQPQGSGLEAAVTAMPGAVWLIGNEPDVKWQDGVTAERYAEHYHDLYVQLKKLDPTCQVAIGGVSQPTPLRLRYLDRILDAYQERYGGPMPVDVWNVHNFVLREERDSWGVDIPPGMPDEIGELREIADHDSMAIFRQQIVGFRRWMAERGQRDKPLIVTEYGILMPNEYGFPPDRVERFMLDTFEFLRTATDPDLGYPADGNRLVQRWCWFSQADARYPTGDLVAPETGELTPLGKAFRNYALTSP